MVKLPMVAIAPFLACALALPAWAAELVVDEENGPYFFPSEAANEARDGDTILLRPGSYEDCMVVRANNVTVKGGGESPEDVVIHSVVCQDKAILVAQGREMTVTNLTFRDAESSQGNGAGIRVEGADLTVDNVVFRGNENGILAMPLDRSTITIKNSLFERNGTCKNKAGCSHGIYVNKVDLLRVENNRFLEQLEGHHIKSRALKTEIVDNVIRDDDYGTSSYLIDISNGGTVLIEGNDMHKGKNTSNRSAAIFIAGEGNKNPSEYIIVRDNKFINRARNTVSFVRNNAKQPAELIGNRIGGDSRPLQGPGEVVRRVSQ